MTTYTRPELTEQERAEIALAFQRIRRMGFAKALAYLLNALYENARLVAEVNQHRATLGIEPLPTYTPNTVTK